MSKITPLMTSLHEGHKADERLKCIDNMLFNKCEDTKDNILRAFWWYRKHSIPLDKVKQAREEIEQNAYPIVHGVNNHDVGMTLNGIFQVLDKLIKSEE